MQPFLFCKRMIGERSRIRAVHISWTKQSPTTLRPAMDKRCQVIQVNTTLHLDSLKHAEREDIAHPIARTLRVRHLPIRIDVYRLEPLMHRATKPPESAKRELCRTRHTHLSYSYRASCTNSSFTSSSTAVSMACSTSLCLHDNNVLICLVVCISSSSAFMGRKVDGRRRRPVVGSLSVSLAAASSRSSSVGRSR